MIDRKSKKCGSTKRRHRLSLQDYTKISDGEGGYVNSWFTEGQLWAAVFPIKASQVFDYRSISTEVTHIIEIDGLEDRVNDKKRFLFNDRIFEILTIEDVQERKIKKIITCKEIPLLGNEPQ